MSGKKDTDYLSISSRIRAMELRLLTADRLERMIDARDDAEALKVLSECGYPTDSMPLEQALNASRTAVMEELAPVAGDPALVDIFRLKYDYHNAKVLVKAGTQVQQAQRLLVAGGRYTPDQLLSGLQNCDQNYRQSVEKAAAVLAETGDPQKADILLDRAYLAELVRLAQECGSAFMQGYAKLMVDAANLRACVRCARLDKDHEFMADVLVDGGNVKVDQLLRNWGQGMSNLFRANPLEEAAKLADRLSKPGSGALTELERLCDDAIMDYQRKAHRVPFGQEVVAGYLFAKEAELTAARTVMAGRMAGLEADEIRRRLRRSYV